MQIIGRWDRGQMSHRTNVLREGGSIPSGPTYEVGTYEYKMPNALQACTLYTSNYAQHSN